MHFNSHVTYGLSKTESDINRNEGQEIKEKRPYSDDFYSKCPTAMQIG